MVIIYGISNCDTIKKVLLWFKKNNIKTAFHDYKKSGITTQKLLYWCETTDWQILLNKKSTTWRGLPDAIKNNITDQNEAIKIMMNNPSIIKRPVIEYKEKIVIGFDEKLYLQTFKN